MTAFDKVSEVQSVIAEGIGAFTSGANRLMFAHYDYVENTDTAYDLRVNLENIPGLLDRYNILPDFLRRLLETKLTHDIKPNKEEQINFFRTFLLDNKIQGKEALNQWLNDNGLDDKRLDTMLFERLQVEKFKSNMFEDKIENKFLESKESLDRVMYSVLRLKDKNQADELYIQIEEKEATFAELVSNYSTGSEKNFNGIIGPVEYGRLDQNLRERLRISKKGQLWPPFEFKENWLIIRHEKNLPSKLDDAMKKRIRNIMYEEWINSKVLGLLDQIRYPKNSKNKMFTDNEKNVIPEIKNSSE